MAIFCEGTNCQKRDTCAYHTDIKDNELFDYMDLSTYGSGSADSTGYSKVEYWCGDYGEYKHYKHINQPIVFDYKKMWNELKQFIESQRDFHKSGLMQSMHESIEGEKICNLLLKKISEIEGCQIPHSEESIEK